MPQGKIKITVRGLRRPPMAGEIQQPDLGRTAEDRMHKLAGTTADALWSLADGLYSTARGVDRLADLHNAVGHKLLDFACWISDVRAGLQDDPGGEGTNRPYHLDLRHLNVGIETAHAFVKAIEKRGLPIGVVCLRRDQEERFDAECGEEGGWIALAGYPVVGELPSDASCAERPSPIQPSGCRP